MIPYIFHVTVIITACFLFYKLLLQKETFFRLNRWTLLACLGVSFTLPLLPVPQQWSWNSTGRLPRFLQMTAAASDTPSSPDTQVSPDTRASLNTPASAVTMQVPATQTAVSSNQTSVAHNANPVPTIPTGPSTSDFRTATPSAHAQPNPVVHTVRSVPGSSPNATRIILGLYLFGVIVFGSNLLLQIIVLLYQSYARPVVQDGPFRIVETTGDRAPCSFGHNIFINPSKYDWETYNQILLHEKIHASGRHTIDILLAEILIVCQWFNPFAWLYRKEVENNLEFLTDHSLLQTHAVEPSVYQLSLLRVAAPNLPYNITTNYNQSLLKRRIIMMNSKRSSLHTIWKYFFLVPLLTCLVCALNKPVAFGQSKNPELTRSSGPLNLSGETVSSRSSAASSRSTAADIAFSGQPATPGQPAISAQPETSLTTAAADTSTHPDRKEGSWFATTKGDKLCFELKGDKDDHTWSNNTCIAKSDLTPPPGVGKTEFRLVRESGTISFTGQFDGDQGYGHYSFRPDENYMRTVRQKGITPLTDDDMLAFFLLDIRNEYLDMLQHNGYPHVTKNNLIAMSAMHIDLPYLLSWREVGYKDISENDIIAVKAMNIDKEYIEDLRNAGYADMKVSDLIAFKAQGIDGQYVKKLNQAQSSSPVKPIPAHDIIAFKSLNIDSQYVASLRAAGYDNIPMENIVAMRSLGIDAAYIKSFDAIGYKDIPVQSMISIKSLGITADYINSFRNIGFKDISAEQLPALKSLHITPEYIKSFRDIGYADISLEQLPALKSLGITPEFVKAFRSIGYNNIPLDQLPALKSMGVTADYVTKMKSKGFVSNDLNKYIQLKSAFQ